MSDTNGHADRDAALARLRDAREEMAERVRRQKAEEYRQSEETHEVLPAPAPPLGQQVQVLRDRVEVLERRVERAAKVVQHLISEFRAAGLKPKASANGKPAARKRP